MGTFRNVFANVVLLLKLGKPGLRTDWVRDEWEDFFAYSSFNENDHEFKHTSGYKRFRTLNHIILVVFLQFSDVA